jgi:hypothetical protein
MTQFAHAGFLPAFQAKWILVWRQESHFRVRIPGAQLKFGEEERFR